jgi:putative Mn2+ efflux pump MntP
MLEIIALIWLTGITGRLAFQKGKPVGWWKFYTVLAWLAGEFIGAFLSALLFSTEDYISALPMAILGAVGGFLIIRAVLQKMPDKPEEGFEFENNPQP